MKARLQASIQNSGVGDRLTNTFTKDLFVFGQRTHIRRKLTIEELQEILNEEHQEIQRNVSPSEQEEDERGPMPTSAIKDLFKKWDAVRAMVLEWQYY
ncbi:uncharacterized protein TNCV_4680651 [Trichonephila clavipes]|nr:uncharacterized protein TNCV_4680651 [Trichonephila clavipes]